MQCLAILIIVIFILATMTPIGESLRTGQPGAGRALRRLADKYNGTFRSGGIYIAPNVRFRYGQTRVTISSTRRRGIGKTARAEIDWPDRHLQIEVRTRQRLEHTPTTGRTGLSIETGDPAFDIEFEIHTNNPDQARTWLSDGVRWQIVRLADATRHSGHLSVLLANGNLQVEKQVGQQRSDHLEEFCERALELYDQAMLTRAVGINFVAEGEAQPVEDPICKVCGEPIDHDMVICRRCRTPHHLDCWQYVGKCSVFGCDETRYVIPTVAPGAASDDAAPDGGGSDV